MVLQSHEHSGKSGTSPRTVTSKRRIVYRKSTWKVYRFDIWSVELVCRVSMLIVDGALLIWVGSGGSGEPELSEIALGVPAGAGDAGRGGLATALLGAEAGGAALARRLAAWLGRPVYVGCGGAFDRFTAPLMERGLVMEIKSKPDLYNL